LGRGEWERKKITFSSLRRFYQGKIDALRARVRELEDEVFRTRNRVVDDLLEIAGKNICDPLAGVSVAALHAYRAPTAPREAAMERLRALPRMPYSVVAYSSATPTEITGGEGVLRNLPRKQGHTPGMGL
jgi:hypothetical protein